MPVAPSNPLLTRAVREVLRTTSKRPDAFAAMALAVYCASVPVSVRAAAELPIPCASGSCGTNMPFVGDGGATAVASGNTLNINQITDSAVLNWARFNISADGTVNFIQPSSTATAINRVHSQTDPSRILGNLNANGRVYILNRNGVLFGDGAKVNVAGLVASSLDITPAAVNNGIAGAALQGSAAFDTFMDADGNPVLTGSVRVERGATIATSEGGQVLMFAPQEIVNEGAISTPGGQTLLAAGTPVYLLTSTNPNLRGLLVEVGVGGTVTNGDAQANAAVRDPAKLVGQIVAERGNVTLAGLAVNQEGRVSATTTVREGGSIRLQARDGGSVDTSGGGAVNTKLLATNGGTLTLAQNSTTDILLSTDSSDTTVDANEQPRSQIELQGRNVFVLEDATVRAKGGNIAISARVTPPDGRTLVEGTKNENSRVYVAAGAVLDVSGADVELAMERNVVRAELRGDELADSPVQRDGPLRGQAVFVDIRETGTREDGTTWQGTPLADVSGQISLVKRDVSERNLNGGTVSIESQGDVILAQGSTIDLSGGSIKYRDGYINTTQLLGSDGRVYDIGDADPNQVYVRTMSGYTIRHDRWGVTDTYSGFGGIGRFEQGYVEGKDAGTLNLLTPRAILDGGIKADVVVGRHQRHAPGLVPEASLYRPYDELPLGGRLVFGANGRDDRDRVGGAVLFGSELILPTLVNADHTAFDPLDPRDPSEPADPQDPDPAERSNWLADDFTTTLRSELFGVNGITRVAIHSNGKVTLPETVALQLPGYAELSVRAGQVDVAGRIAAPSGSIDITALETIQTLANDQDIELDVRRGAVLDVSGQWVNDSVRLNAADAQLAPLSIDGGKVSLSASQGSLRLQEGSVIDASGGAWLRRDESMVAGDAGSIALSASRGDPLLTPPVTLELGAQLSVYGVEKGGSLSIAAPEICVATNGGCSAEDAAVGLLTLTPDDLLAGGFGTIALRSNERGLTVTSGTNFDLKQRNLLLDAAAFNTATGASLRDISTVTLLPDHLRAATDLTLSASIANLPNDLAYTNENFAEVPGLVIERGAVIGTDPGASVALQSNSTLVVDGAITAPAGSISLTLDNTLRIGESLQAQGIWLGADARLDVSGTTLLQPDLLGLRIGEVLDGGSVTFVAQRGSVIANQGSLIDVSGASSVLDIGDASGSILNVQPRLIASDGGLLSVTAADAILLSGDVHAHAGSGLASASGGELRVTLNANQRAAGAFIPEATAQRIVVSQDFAPISIAPGTPMPTTFSGQAHVAANDIEAAGFDSVVLNARTNEGADVFNTPQVATGTIEFDGDVNLAVGRQLQLDAARITGDGNVNVTAPYVALGHRDTKYQGTPSLTPRGENDAESRFSVNGSFVEAIGHSVIDGFSDVHLSSSGDLRLRGVQQTNAPTVAGGVTTNADLTLRADQIYAATLSDFAISVADHAEGVLRVESTGESRATVLSAGSHLTLNAPTIEQAGVLRAPFGTIELNADELRLQAGSLTSTSAEGAIIPFGAVQAGDDWVYGLDGLTLVNGTTLAVPQQTVSLDGKQVQIESGAVIDVSGGGDLLAYEFVPGTTGNRDVLSADTAPGRFAIVPALNLQYAPHDPQESVGSPLSVGDAIHISGGVQGLPEGDYVLLPARYALLEGAFVVEAANGYTDLRAGAVLPQLNGSSIVSGYRKVAGTQFADARSSGFVITSGDVLAREARYNTSLASSFFAEQAAENATAVARLPQDAGVLAITATTQLDIDGSLRAVATAEGRGAAVDISAQNLRISDTATAAEGEVVVSAASLSGLGAESLLLGGRRASTDDGTAINVASQTVTVDVGTSLSAPEILLAATDTVRVSENATLTATSEVDATDTYLVSGDGAMLRLASGKQTEIRRDGESGASGTLVLAEGARLDGAGGALALDASLDTQSAATLALAGGSLSLGASRINLGGAPEDANGLALDDAQLSSLSLDELVLVSRSTIDLYGDVALQVNDVAFDAAGLRGMTQDSGSITAAGSLSLTNRAARQEADAVGMSGTLQVNAKEIVVGEGVQRVSGYAAAALNASGQLRGADQGGLSVAGDLSLVTPVVVAASAANTTFSADGAMQVSAATGPAAVHGAELGGTLTLTADSVNIATRIEAAAGTVSIAASTGDVTLSSGAIIDVSGRQRDFDGVAMAAPAGNVKLSANAGGIATRAGSLIDVSGAGAGEAGSIAIKALAGTVSLGGQLSGAAQAAADSGRFDIDAQSVGDLSALNTTLNAGGFFAARELRQRTGDLVVAGADSVRAQQVSLTADRGNIVVNGEIDARAADGGDVVLSAHDSIDVTGRILANATTAEGDGGDVALRAEIGGVALGSASLIDVSGGTTADAQGGEVNVRVLQTVARTITDGDSANDALLLAGTIRGADQTTLEAFKVYTDDDNVLQSDGGTGRIITTTNTAADAGNVLYSDAVAFMTDYADGIIAALGRTEDANFRLLPGIEIQTAGDLSLGVEGSVVDWNLYGWRFGNRNVPGMLTLRAGGDLTFNGSLSDGFATTIGVVTQASSTAYRLPASPSDSWSYRLVAGADTGSADVMAIDDAVAAADAAAEVPVNGNPPHPSQGSGDFTIAAGAGTGSSPYRMVRTGNGSIDVAAAGDFILGNQHSVLYTAGVASAAGVPIGGNTTVGLGNRAYPIDGGDIRIEVRDDIEGAQTDQLVTDWLWRVGNAPNPNPDAIGFATAWTVNFARFRQNVGALGGGDVDVAAGGDIRNFSASIPSIGRQMASVSPNNSVVDAIGGGALSVGAGGNIAGGSYYVGLGTGRLWSEGNVTTSTYGTFDLYPVLALGDAQWNVTARGSVGIEAIVNPTLLPQISGQPATSSGGVASSFFSTYTSASAARIRAVSGDALLSNNASNLASALISEDPLSSDTLADNLAILQIYAPTLQMAALSGDVLLNGNTTLFPAVGSNVELFADDNVSRGISNAPLLLFQSDADPRSLPSIAAPHASAEFLSLLNTVSSIERDQHAAAPVHAGDDSVARIVARTGDVTFASDEQFASSTLNFATPARVVAAGDIVDLPLAVQHDDANDLTSLAAGGDIHYTVSRGSTGIIERNDRAIVVDGPGTLQLAAGGDVDLKTSAGIVTRGNVVNTNLPDGGANVSVLAGVLESELAYDAAIARYLQLSDAHDADLIDYVGGITGEDDLTQQEAEARFEQLAGYRDALVAFMESRSGRDDLTHDSALALFKDASRSEQRVLLERVLFSELTFSGREAAKSGSSDFRRGFMALETLVPGSNPDTEAGEVNPYAGDIALYFSRIYTLDGGDISLLTPGGEINVGLATPPASFGLDKGAADLGLVAQKTGSINALAYRDFAVNESRVFAADGGNILVWSTDGDIDAGRGAKTAISAPPPEITFDPESGAPIVNFPPALTGSGIQTLATSAGTEPGNVDLFAPRGVVNAGDAGIIAGNLTIAATAVLGADNIQVSGVAVGVPVDTGGLGASLANVSAAASSATSAATTSVDAGRNQEEQPTSLADSALSWLDVFVVGLGEDNCKQDDIECLKRQKTD